MGSLAVNGWCCGRLSLAISNCTWTWVWNSFVVFPFLIISSPPLSVSASVRMDSPPGSHSRPRNHRHSRAVICAQTRCYSIDCPAWPIIFVCWFHLSAPTVVRYRRFLHLTISHTLFCLVVHFYILCSLFFLSSAPDHDESCVVSATLPKFFRFFFCILRFWFFFLWFSLFDFFDFSFSNVK